MGIEFLEYRARKIVNVHKHVDGPWFWGKYTAHPYVGCRSGCEFCYLRGSRYLGRRDPETFDHIIQIKLNAVELLRKELPSLSREIISVGDWQQPAEDRYRLSRSMLEVVREHRFPLFIVERSPLVTRDLDLLIEINRQSWTGVLFSISNLDPNLKQAFEPRSPGVKARLQAMVLLAHAGITVGTSMMPVLPFVGDHPGLLEDLILATRDHGGICVLAGGLTMDGLQAERSLSAARRFKPHLETQWRELYRWDTGRTPSFGPSREYTARLGRTVRNLCAKHGILDRLPRYIQPGPLAVNKRIAERLFLRAYDLELEEAEHRRIRAYRRAAWTVDEWPQSLELIVAEKGQAGIRSMPAIGEKLTGLIESWMGEMQAES